MPQTDSASGAPLTGSANGAPQTGEPQTDSAIGAKPTTGLVKDDRKEMSPKPKADLTAMFYREIDSRHEHIANTLAELVGADGIGKNGHRIKLKFRNLRVEMQGNPILKGINGDALPGQVLSIMGPSGSGKTTLLNCLSGRQKLSAGRISLNDHAHKKAMKRHIAYVLQDEAFFGVMTVRQVMYFQASIRLPDTMPVAKKQERADQIMKLLGIDKCADSIVGTMFMRGISGGERKRLNVGVQLLTWPSLILLDEPTSGLDSSTAYDLILLTRELARRGCTVITTVHQPSSPLFNLFDRLLVLAEGNTIYQGDAQGVVEHMERVGFKCPQTYNPGDFVLELAKSKAGLEKFLSLSNEERGNVVRTISASNLASLAKFERNDKGSMISLAEGKQGSAVSLVEGKQRSMFSLAEGKQGTVASIAFYEEEEEGDWDNSFATSWWTQFTALYNRAVLVKKSDTFDGLQIFQISVVAVVTSLVWFQTGNSETEIQDRFGLVFFIAIFWTFFPMFNSVATFPAERAVLLRERAQGSYRLSAYYCAKMVAEMPLQWLTPTVFIIVVYWATDINDNVGSFFAFWVLLLLAVELATSLGMLISAAEVNLKRALVILSILVLSSMLLGGFYVDPENIPVWVRWLQWLSFIKYTFGALATQAFDDNISFSCAEESEYSVCVNGEGDINGHDVLDNRNIDNIPVVYSLVVLFGTFVVKIATYFTLFYRYKPKSPTS